MNLEKPLFWHQGLFLQPQHLQLADLQKNALLQPFRKYSKPHFWGVAGLEIQEAGLGNKSFEILNGEIVFQDGTYAVFPGNSVLKPRSFDDAWLEGEKPFTVFLGLRKWDPAGENATVVPSMDETSDINTRFATTADPEEIRDMHGDGPAAQVKQLSYVLRIFWETEQEKLDNYNLIPIAELERDGEEIRLSRKFTPPCLSVDASDWIVRTLKDIRDQITSRCRQLEEYKSPKEVQSMDFDIGYMVFLLALRSLNRYVPLLYHMTETKNLHPWDVYSVLRQMIGELSTFSEGLNAVGERLDGTRALPPYDHLALWECFSAAQSLVSEMLDSITVGAGHRIRLEYDGAYYSGEISERMLGSRNRFWLVLRTEAPADEITESFRRVAKLSVKRNITTLLARAVPGIPLEYYPVPPPGLPRRANSHYFRIDHTSSQWLEVEPEQILSLFWDSAPEDMTAEILVIGS